MAQTALITGASSGIGMELAGVFAREGYDLYLVSRDEARLAQVRDALTGAYGVSVTYLALDLAATGAPEALCDALEAQHVAVDVLVNNAGFGMHGAYLDSDAATLRALLRVNVVVPSLLARLIGAGMRDRGAGRILNVASIASFFPGPYMAAYNASKAYVLSLSEALAGELEGSGVTVTALCPGPTATDFWREAHMEQDVKNMRMYRAKDVAEYGYRALVAGKRVAVYRWKQRLMTHAVRVLPRRLVATAAGRYLK